jgi:hypothetical protein
MLIIQRRFTLPASMGSTCLAGSRIVHSKSIAATSDSGRTIGQKVCRFGRSKDGGPSAIGRTGLLETVTLRGTARPHLLRIQAVIGLAAPGKAIRQHHHPSSGADIVQQSLQVGSVGGPAGVPAIVTALAKALALALVRPFLF